MSGIAEQLRDAKAPKVVRVLGNPNRVVVDGKEINRREKIHLKGIGVVTCAPYDNHFVFRHLPKTGKGWTLFCTCGSPAVVTGWDAYAMKENGGIMSCYYHLNTGRHADGSS